MNALITHYRCGLHKKRTHMGRCIMFVLFWKKKQPTIFALSTRNQDRLVSEQHWDLWDSRLVSCGIQQETHVRPLPLLPNIGYLPFCAATHSDPSQGPSYFTGLFLTNKAWQAPLVLFVCFFTQLPVSFLSREPLLSEAENFTIYIKNFIRFPKFEFSK